MSSSGSARVVAEYSVSDKQVGLRLDHFLMERIPKLSRQRIQEAIRTRVELPGRAGRPRPALLLRAGDRVVVREIELDEPPFPAELVPRILHEDELLVAVDKPAGLPVHSTRRAVRNQLVRWLRERYGPGLALAHRIDRETSGIVLSTRAVAAARQLGADFAHGRVHKEYLAVVHGQPPERFTVDLPIGPDPASAVHIKQAAGVAGGLPARTDFVRERPAGAGPALVRAFPTTGRRHQIRVHLAAAGFPVVGDKLYARGERHFLNYTTRGLTARMVEELGAARHLLHAAVLAIDHPDGRGRLRLEAPLPADLLAVLDGAS